MFKVKLRHLSFFKNTCLFFKMIITFAFVFVLFKHVCFSWQIYHYALHWEKNVFNCICLFLVINVIKTSNKCSEWCDKTSVFSAFYHFYYYIFFCLRFKCLAVFISNLNFSIKCVPFPNTIVSKWTSTYIYNYFYYSIFFFQETTGPTVKYIS